RRDAGSRRFRYRLSRAPRSPSTPLPHWGVPSLAPFVRRTVASTLHSCQPKGDGISCPSRTAEAGRHARGATNTVVPAAALPDGREIGPGGRSPSNHGARDEREDNRPIDGPQDPLILNVAWRRVKESVAVPPSMRTFGQ